MPISPVTTHSASQPFAISQSQLTETVIERLRRLRNECGMSRREVADRVFRTHHVIQAWEMGRTKPTFDVLDRLAQTYNRSIDYIVTGRESGR